MAEIDYKDLRDAQKAGIFKDSDDGKGYYRTRGTATFSGLSLRFLVTCLDITDVAAKIPTSALLSRNSLSIRNKSATKTIYIGEANTVTADSVIGTTSGWEIPANGELNIDITNDIELWAIAETGVTIRAKVLEVA